MSFYRKRAAVACTFCRNRYDASPYRAIRCRFTDYETGSVVVMAQDPHVLTATISRLSVNMMINRLRGSSPLSKEAHVYLRLANGARQN